jgi:hypothetical protein
VTFFSHKIAPPPRSQKGGTAPDYHTKPTGYDQTVKRAINLYTLATIMGVRHSNMLRDKGVHM